MRRDRLGRRRVPGQERGLRPMHPALPADHVSKAVRVAMPAEDWERLETLVRALGHSGVAETSPRALGLVLSRLLHSAPAGSDWPGATVCEMGT